MTDALLIVAVVAAATLIVIAWGVFLPRAQLFGKIRSRLTSEGDRRVSLTFDDGPWPGSTDRILDTLASHDVKATFFVIGRHAERHPELLRRMVNEGHAIGNHSFDHSRLGLFHLWAYWRDQIDRSQQVIERATGHTPTMFRPPMGFKAPPIMRAARRRGLDVWTWNRRCFDAGIGSDGTTLRVVSAMRPGDVLLMHDGRDPASTREPGCTAAILPDVLEMLRDADLHPVRLDRS